MKKCSFVKISEKENIKIFLRIEINEKRRYKDILDDLM